MSEVRVLIAVLVCLLAQLISGCGTSTYNAAMAKRLDELRRDAPYAALTAPTVIPGTSVKIALPKMLPRFVTPETPDPVGLKGHISVERVKFVALMPPGVFCAYDGEGELADGSMTPMACQIAVIPKTAPESQAIAALLEAGLQLVFPNQPASWQAEEVEAAGGGKRIPWKMLRREGDLLFDVFPKERTADMQFKKLPAVVEVWWHESEPYHTLFFWRVAKEVDDKVNLIKLAKLSAGTITVGPPPTEQKPEEAPAADQPAAKAAEPAVE